MGTRPIDGKKHNQINGRWRRRRDSNPRYRIYQYDGLANRWFQPLTHVSAWSAALTAVWPQAGRYSHAFRDPQRQTLLFFDLRLRRSQQK